MVDKNEKFVPFHRGDPFLCSVAGMKVETKPSLIFVHWIGLNCLGVTNTRKTIVQTELNRCQAKRLKQKRTAYNRHYPGFVCLLCFTKCFLSAASTFDMINVRTN